MSVQTYVEKQRLEGQVCIIAGSASMIGQAVARRLTAEGATVSGIDIDKHAAGAITFHADLAHEEEVENVLKRYTRSSGVSTSFTTTPGPSPLTTNPW